MATFYITFGQKYRTQPHPVLGADPRLADGWYEITANTLDEAYDAAVARITSAFAFAYDKPLNPDLYEHGRLGTLDTLPVRTDCDRCGGGGTVAARHPAWGQRNCPEDYVEDDCPSCGGAGYVLTYPAVQA